MQIAFHVMTFFSFSSSFQEPGIGTAEAGLDHYKLDERTVFYFAKSIANSYVSVPLYYVLQFAQLPPSSIV